jgi:hypothetical protein
MQVVMKPCNQFGTASAIWMYNYTEETCDETDPNHQCSPEYSDWCCGGQQCMTWNDKCQVGRYCLGLAGRHSRGGFWRTGRLDS